MVREEVPGLSTTATSDGKSVLDFPITGDMRDHGVRSVECLREQGLGWRQIESYVEMGTLKRICRGWYALPQADEQVVRAIRMGGRLGCMSGCRFYGLWVPHLSDLHSTYGEGRRPRSAPGIQLHPYSGPMTREPLWPLAACLQQAAHRHDSETALIVMESAANLGLIDRAGLRDVIAALPRGRQRVTRFLSVAESGSETRVRLFLQRRRFAVRPQVVIPGVGRVDLLVGGVLIIECDSDEHHRSREQHHDDRRRDLAALDLGYRTIRLTYHQIWFDWEATQTSLLAELRRRRHIPR